MIIDVKKLGEAEGSARDEWLGLHATKPTPKAVKRQARADRDYLSGLKWGKLQLGTREGANADWLAGYKAGVRLNDIETRFFEREWAKDVNVYQQKEA